MVSMQDVNAVTALLLGVAFLLVWRSNRLSLSALFWGVAHVALALAAITGYRYMENPTVLGLGLMSAGLTAVFVGTLWAGNDCLRRRHVSLRGLLLRTCALFAAIVVIGFGWDQNVAQLAVLLSMCVAYLWSGYLFLASYRLKWVGWAFLVRGGVLLVSRVSNPSSLAGVQPLSVDLINWLAMAVLALLLIHVAFSQSRRRLEQVLKYLPDAVLARTPEGSVLFCNEVFARLAGGGAPDSLVGTQVPPLGVGGGEIQSVGGLVQRGISAGTVVFEREIQPVSGTPFPAEIVVSGFDDFGETIVLVRIRDLTEHKQAELERVRRETTDELTGLPNRKQIELLLESIIFAGKSSQNFVAVALFDIDHLKRVNDVFGRQEADQLVRAFSVGLKQFCGSGDLLGRLMGDEFVLVITDANHGRGLVRVEEAVSSACARLRQNLERDGISIETGLTAGISILGRDGLVVERLLQSADAAKFEAKSSKRGSWCFYSQGVAEREIESLRIESALKKSLAAQELVLHYQPIVDSQTGQLVKVESLLRWHSATLGKVSPALFIPIAEKAGLILDIGAWVIDEAVGQLARWRRDGGGSPVVSINVSVRQFAHPGFEVMLLETLARHGVSPDAVELELTESVLASEGTELAELLGRLKTTGFGLSLDDFGTGYSSLSYLVRFSLTTVKIDRSFIQDIEGSSRSCAVVKTIIAMGHSLGLKVVAEGVETPAQRAFLMAEGCDYLQGYLLGKPCQAEDITFDLA